MLESKRRRLQRDLKKIIYDNLDFHLYCMHDDTLTHAERFLNVEALDKYTLSVPAPAEGHTPEQQTFTWLDDCSPISAQTGPEGSPSVN